MVCKLLHNFDQNFKFTQYLVSLRIQQFFKENFSMEWIKGMPALAENQGDGSTDYQGCHVSGKCQGILAIWPMSGNFVMSCWRIVREFCHEIIFRLKLPSYDKGSTWVVYVNVFFWQIWTQGLLIIPIKPLPFQNPGCMGGIAINNS